ncbi:ABC transporter permease subunit [Streptomyces hesseae]|uniref:ABC transporter permease n=1 Tax=Streptomyces hesseae TaxID=3075519 RepID=A0ABU2SSI7_9ACTN|nr:ABC transporter permease [Streptomyces sp. DSM 40473]MDT0450884.1 ABC transporter permease [Streptomyces sp. DSM 40473]
MTTPQSQPTPAPAQPQAGGPAPTPSAAAPGRPAPQSTPQGQPQWPGQAPLGGYVSPIPIRKATLADALAAEWTKIRSIRSTVWTLGTTVLLIVGMGLLAASVISATDSTAAMETDRTPVLVLGIYGTMLSLICVITLGVLTMSSEYGTGLIRTTLTACPDRARVLTAKAVVFFLLTLVTTTVATTLVAVATEGIAGRLGAVPTAEQWLKATVGVSLFMSLVGVLALAVGAMLRHSAGAIAVMLGLVMMPLVLAMFLVASDLNEIRSWLLVYSIPNQLGVFYDVKAGTGPSGWDPLWIMTLVTGAALGGAYLSLAKRDA